MSEDNLMIWYWQGFCDAKDGKAPVVKPLIISSNSDFIRACKTAYFDGYDGGIFARKEIKQRNVVNGEL